MGTDEVVLAAAADILEKIREDLVEQAASVESFKNSVIEGKEFYSLVIIPKPIWAQSRLQEDIRVLRKGDLEGAVGRAKEIYKEIYENKPTAPSRPMTIGVLLPFARSLPKFIGDDWFSLIVNERLPYGRETGEYPSEEEMNEEEWEKLKSSRFIELPRSAWAPFFNK